MGTFQRAGDAEKLPAIRHFHRLDKNLAGLAEGRVDRQLGTAAAETAVRKPLRARLAKAVAGIIDLEHEERHARRARPLQHGQPIRGLFEGNAETRFQHVDIIACADRSGMEGRIRHHQRMRGVTAEFEAGKPAGLVGGEFQCLDFGGHGDRHADQTGLHRHLAQLIEGRQPLGQEQALRMAIVAAAPVGHGRDGQHLHHNAVFALQPGFQRAKKIVAGVEHRREGFRFLLDAWKMVRAALEDLMHLVDRKACAGERGGAALAGEKLVEVGQALGLLAIGAEELYHRGGSVGRSFGDLDKLLIAG